MMTIFNTTFIRKIVFSKTKIKKILTTKINIILQFFTKIFPLGRVEQSTANF
jgi:hypothetical protein